MGSRMAEKVKGGAETPTLPQTGKSGHPREHTRRKTLGHRPVARNPAELNLD